MLDSTSTVRRRASVNACQWARTSGDGPGVAVVVSPLACRRRCVCQGVGSVACREGRARPGLAAAGAPGSGRFGFGHPVDVVSVTVTRTRPKTASGNCRVLAEKRQRPRCATASDCVKLRRARESPLLERSPLHAYARKSDPKLHRNQNAKRDSSKVLKRRLSQLRFQIRVCIRACVPATRPTHAPTGGTIRGSDRDPLLSRPKHVAIRQCVCDNRVVIHPPPLCPGGFEGGIVDGGARNW